MRLRVLSVGKDRSGLFQPGVDTYAGRIRRYLPFELVELPASKQRDPRKAREDEGARLVSAAAGDIVALDVGGKALSSEAFAALLEEAMVSGRELDFVIGGDEGLSEGLLKAAHRRLSLGPMILPHRLARLVLVEQIYRGLSILRGEPYHK